MGSESVDNGGRAGGGGDLNLADRMLLTDTLFQVLLRLNTTPNPSRAGISALCELLLGVPARRHLQIRTGVATAESFGKNAQSATVLRVGVVVEGERSEATMFKTLFVEELGDLPQCQHSLQ